MKKNNLRVQKNGKKHFKIYGKSKLPQSKARVIFKYFIFFIVIAAISYLSCVLAYSYLKREHVTSVSIPDSYARNKSEGKQQTKEKHAKEEQIKKFDIQAVEMPKYLLFQNDNLQKFLKKAKQDGKNAVIVTLKDVDGSILYDSEVDFVSEWKTGIKNAVDMSKIVAQIKKEGLSPIAKINAFLDQRAPSASRENTFVYESNESVCKFEDKKTRRYQTFLNPCYENVQKYILDLANEAHNLGFHKIFMDNFNFPYTTINSTVKDFDSIEKDVALKNIITRLKKITPNIIIGYDVNLLKEDVVLNNKTSKSKAEICYGGDILKYGISHFVVTLKNYNELKNFKDIILKIIKNNPNLDFIVKIENSRNLDQIMEELEEQNIVSNIVLNL